MNKLFFYVALAAVCVACNDDKDDGGNNIPELGVQPVAVSTEIQEFFEENLPQKSTVYSGEPLLSFDYNETTAVAINDTEAFQGIFSAQTELPIINFDEYTLVIGQCQVGGTAYGVLGQGIDFEADKAVINLKIEVPEETYWMICPLYFWGIYPKFTQTEIEINVF